MKRRMVLGLAVVLAGAGTAACGDDGGGGSPLEIVSRAAEVTESARTARVEMKMAFGPGDEMVTTEANGVLDFVSQAGQMEMKMSGFGDAPIEMELRILEGVAYAKLPESVDGKAWVRSDLEDLTGGLGASGDPTEALGYLEAISGEVTETGTDKLRGVATTKYHATVSLTKAAEAAEGKAREGLQQIIEAGITSMPTDIWIDEQGRARRTVSTLDFSQADGEMKEAGKLTTTMELYDFGVKVNVVAPPAGEVGTMPNGVGSGSATGSARG